MTNPYRSPAAPLQDLHTPDPGTPYSPRIFAMDGRIGRIRYIVYGFIVQLVVTVAAGMVAALALPAVTGRSDADVLAIPLMVAIYAPILITALVLARRRLNDLDLSGWVALLLLVPLANFILVLVLLFWPGSKGANRFGPRPVPNSGALVFFGLLVPLALVAALAAVAIPAYQEYVKRAQAGQVQPLP